MASSEVAPERRKEEALRRSCAGEPHEVHGKGAQRGLSVEMLMEEVHGHEGGDQVE